MDVGRLFSIVILLTLMSSPCIFQVWSVLCEVVSLVLQYLVAWLIIADVTANLLST